MRRIRIQTWLKSRLRRSSLSLAAALAITILCNPAEKSGGPVMGWWGMLYPKFCLVAEENAEDLPESEGQKAGNALKKADIASDEPENAADGMKDSVKIKPAFWLAEELAKLLD